MLLLCIPFLFSVGCTKRKEVLIKIGEKEFTKEELKSIFDETSVDSSVKKALVVSQLVEKVILEEEAKKLRVNLTQSEIESFLKENGMSEKNRETAKLYLLRQKVAQAISKDITPPVERVDAIMKEMKDVVPEKFIFQQVLLNKEDVAYKVLEEIKKGMTFEEAAKKYSIAPEGKHGGLIDYLNADELPIELVKVLKNMKEDEVSKVVKSPFGYHILKLKNVIKQKRLSDKEKEALAVEEAKKEIAGENYADWFAKKRKEYNVSIKWEEIEKIN